MPSSKPRARLSEAQVITIFQVKASASSATKVANVYGVSGKTVRDIWKGRTWSRETSHLDTSRPLLLKPLGRPKGRRDTKPRSKRVSGRTILTGSAAQEPGRHGVQIARHGAARLAFEQDALHAPLSYHANLNYLIAGAAQSTGSAAFSDKPSAAYRSGAPWWTSSTLCHVSVDEQLHEWDAFWRTSPSTDPFRFDWESH
jgi:hypothetical protein